MNNGILKLSWASVKTALVYGLVMGLGGMLMYAAKIGDLWALDWHVLVNTGFTGFVGALVMDLFTTNKGNFVGLVNTGE